ncbi:hypothetical protein V500_05006 [Pseudogymnoascus sp. VKM F-4518 (FW-2643)]|nr:hypothetical protein V500_05006 [Pseudogymnoascus sp. VKM F-4518 (FW-2643)]
MATTSKDAESADQNAAPLIVTSLSFMPDAQRTNGHSKGREARSPKTQTVCPASSAVPVSPIPMTNY